MNTRLFLLAAIVILGSGCAGPEPGGAGGVSGTDWREARERRTVLPGMTPQQVRSIWTDPHEVVSAGRREKWIYHPGMRSGGFILDTTVTFTDGRVSEVLNGDVMSTKARTTGPGANIFLH
jgi:hypothetical protein